MGWGLTETDSIVALSKAEIGKGLGLVGLGLGSHRQTNSFDVLNKVGKGLGLAGLVWDSQTDHPHCCPQQGRGRQGSGVCWTGLRSHRPTASMPSTRPR